MIYIHASVIETEQKVQLCSAADHLYLPCYGLMTMTMNNSNRRNARDIT